MTRFNGLIAILMAAAVAGAATDILAGGHERSELSDPIVAANRTDASLNGLFVLSADRVWAVGDRGQILATENGGSDWRPQFSRVTVNLYAVHFANTERGWCVGGWIDPRTRQSTGVVLATQDGGITWTTHVPTGLPRLLGITQVSPGRLRAWGDFSPHMGTCLFESPDGITWHGLTGNGPANVNAVGWGRGETRLIIDSEGQLHLSGTQKRTEPVVIAPRTAPLRVVKHDGENWLAAGGLGRVLISPDGLAWNQPTIPLPKSALQFCHWNCVATHGDRIWIAGYPGSVLLRSSDRGRSWQVELNPYSIPRNDLAFADPNRGWAVGANGAILATRDGGSNWFIQRQSWHQLAVLSVVGSNDKVPWPALTAASWEHRSATGSLVVHDGQEDNGLVFPTSHAKVLRQLAPRFGIAEHTTWTAYPLTNHMGDPTVWREYYGIQKLSPVSLPTMMEIDLAIAYQIWRPQVVLTASLTAVDEIDRAVARAVQRSAGFAAGADHAGLSAVSAALGLKSWRCAKIVEIADVQAARFSIPAEHILRGSGIAVEDVLRPLLTWDQLRIQGCSMRTVPQEFLNHAAYESLLGGIALGPETNRSVSLDNVGNYQLVVARSHREAAIDRLLAQPIGSVESQERWNSQLGFLLGTLPKHDIPFALMRIARESLQQRNWDRARHALLLLADADDATDIRRWANLHAATLLGSDELCAWVNLSDSVATDLIANQSLENKSSVVADWKNETPFENEVVLASASASTTELAPVRQASYEARVPELKTQVQDMVPSYTTDLQSSIERIRIIDSQILSLSKNPEKLLLQQSRIRRLIEFTTPSMSPSTELLELVAGQPVLGPFAQAAAQELHLVAGRIDLLHTAMKAIRANQPPLLDGKLDDDIWLRTPVTELAGQANATARVQFGYDDQYLYVAFDCPRQQNSSDRRARGKRERDMDLVGTDHVHMMLDTDRDYATTHELGINEHRESFDRCLGFREWNPAWYIAVDQREDRWRAETAISLKDLTVVDNVSGRAWAISIYRYLPQQGIESWSNAGFTSLAPQSGRLLLFEP